MKINIYHLDTLHAINTSQFPLTTVLYQAESPELHNVYKQYHLWLVFFGMLFLQLINNCLIFCSLGYRPWEKQV